MKSKKYVKKNKRETQKHKKNYKTQKYVKSIGNFTRKYLFKNSVGGKIILKPLNPSYLIKVNEKLKKINNPSASDSENVKKIKKALNKEEIQALNDEKNALINKLKNKIISKSQKSLKSQKSQYSEYSPISPIDDFLMGLNNDEKQDLVDKIC